MKELHGLAEVPVIRTGTYGGQSIEIRDAGDKVCLLLSASYPTELTPEEARFVARLLLDAAARVDPTQRTIIPATTRPTLVEIGPPPTSPTVTEMKPTVLSPERLAEIADIRDEDIDTSDIPEMVVPPEAPVTAEPKAAARPPDELTPEELAPLEEPPAKKRFRPRPGGPVWTLERKEVMRRLVPLGLPKEVVLEELRKLDGEPILSVNRVVQQAGAMRLVWGEQETGETTNPDPEPTPEPEPVSEPEPTSDPTPPTPEPPPIAAAETIPEAAPIAEEPQAPSPLNGATVGPIEADREQVARWAGERGISFYSWADLHKVNAKRHEYNLRPFKQRAGFRIGAAADS